MAAADATSMGLVALNRRVGTIGALADGISCGIQGGPNGDKGESGGCAVSHGHVAANNGHRASGVRSRK